jgi:NADP-dependent 3-hydroxy acid dehydrogenase YdfG
MSDNIEGKIVVITGASSGLGEATARLLSTKGAILVLGARGGRIASRLWRRRWRVPVSPRRCRT